MTVNLKTFTASTTGTYDDENFNSIILNPGEEWVGTVPEGFKECTVYEYYREWVRGGTITLKGVTDHHYKEGKKTWVMTPETPKTIINTSDHEQDVHVEVKDWIDENDIKSGPDTEPDMFTEFEKYWPMVVAAIVGIGALIAIYMLMKRGEV